MKTQLIEDFGESGSAPADPGRNRPVEQSQGAIPQAEQTLARTAEPTPMGQPLLAGAVESGDGAEWLAELMALEAELRSRPALAIVPEPADTSPVPEPANAPSEPERRNTSAVEPEPRSMPAPALELRNTPAPEPELRLEPALAGDSPGPSAPWPELNSQPAHEIAHGSQAQRSNFLKRRTVAWGTAAMLLALLAGGGLWLHGESKVEGAVAVLATRKPVPTTSASRSPVYAAPAVSAAARPDPSSGRQAEAGEASGRLTAAEAAEVPTAPTARTTAVDSGAVKTPAPAERPSDSNSENLPQEGAYTPKHRPAKMLARVRKHARAESDADTLPDSESSSRERLEETFLHCRAHGYGKKECLDRSCEMTRFGFACQE